MSIIDEQELRTTLMLELGNMVQVNNPLGTSYDIANLFLDGQTNELDCSPFLDSWDGADISKFENVFGVWLSHTNEHFFLNVGYGGRENAPDDDLALFFTLDKAWRSKPKTFRLVVTCMN